MIDERAKKLEELSKLCNPYPSINGVTYLVGDPTIYKNLDEVRVGKDTLREVDGRITQINNIGKCMFIQVMMDGNLKQIFIEKQKEESFAIAKLLQTGDIVRAVGRFFLTAQNKTCLYTEKLIFGAKALRDVGKVLKEDSTVKNEEILRRQRYIDYIVNGTATLRQRSKIIQSIRDHLFSIGYDEVETRTLLPINSGANAKPFVTKYNVIGEDYYLRVAPELDLKRLLVGGMHKIFEIGKCFRNEGMSNKHNPEFTSLEAYTAFADYNDGMDLCLSIIHEAFEVIVKKIPEDMVWGMKALIDKYAPDTKYEDIMDVFENTIEQKLAEEYKDKLVIVEKFPTYSCPLAKTYENDSNFVERFEIYYNGMEIANGYSELNNPVEQRKRFEEQQLLKDKMDLDEDFLVALEHGMPPAAGIGIGIDRLLMIVLEKDNIKDVISFPPYKSK